MIDRKKGNSLPLQNINKNHSNEDIDVISLIIQLWKGKVTILVTMFFFILICIFYLTFAKEKWTSTTIVTEPSAGQVANYNAALGIVYSQSPSDKPSIVDLQKQLFNRFSASISALAGSLANLEEPLILNVDQLNKGNDDSLTISFVAPSAKQAQSELTKYISTVNKDVVKDYGEDIKRNLGVKANELSNILDTHRQIAINKKEHRVDVLKQALKIAQESGVKQSKLNQADYLSDDTLYLLGSDALNAMVVNEATKPLNFDDDYYSAERALLAVTHLKIQVDNLNSFRYIAKADLPIKRDSPKKSILLVIAVFLGFLFGICLVIVRNMIQNYR